MQILYLDVLLMVNYGLDFLSLYLAGGILHMPRKCWRLLAAALPGAGFSALAVLFLEQTFWYYPAFILCGAGMVGVAYGKCGGKRGFFLCLAAHLFASVVLGGAISALYGFLDGWIRPGSVGHVGKAEFLLLLSLLAGLCVSLLNRALRSCGSGQRQTVRIRAFGREKTVLLLTDSGHMLRDPLSGRTVLIVSPRALQWLPPGVKKSLLEGAPVREEALRRCIRMIPAGGVGGGTLLYGFLPDKLTLADGRNINGVIAVGREKDYGGADGLMPPLPGDGGKKSA